MKTFLFPFFSLFQHELQIVNLAPPCCSYGIASRKLAEGIMYSLETGVHTDIRGNCFSLCIKLSQLLYWKLCMWCAQKSM